MSITVICELQCAAGKGAEFLQLWKDDIAETSSFPGCESIETYQDQDDPDLIVLLESWGKRSDREAYLAWRTSTGYFDRIRLYLAHPPRRLFLNRLND